jgi:hypothetical protein
MRFLKSPCIYLEPNVQLSRFFLSIVIAIHEFFQGNFRIFRSNTENHVKLHDTGWHYSVGVETFARMTFSRK